MLAYINEACKSFVTFTILQFDVFISHLVSAFRIDSEDY